MTSTARLHPPTAAAPQPDGCSVSVRDEPVTEYIPDVDLSALIRLLRRRVPEAASSPTSGARRPTLVLGVRVYVDDDGAACLCPPLSEPQFERLPGALAMYRNRREVRVTGNLALLWSLLRSVDGRHTTAQILATLPEERQAAAEELLHGLADAGIVDLSGRPIARFVHTVTKKGVLPNGGLDDDEVRALTADGDYRTYPNAARLPVRAAIPDRLAPLHAVIRARRTTWDYDGRPIARAELEAMLTVACGVTGTVDYGGRELKLRAYPSGGALYAVEVYPVAFTVDGLAPGVYHYHAADSVLEAVRPGVERAAFLDAAAPPQRPSVAGSAVLICLTGVFPRYERKYGEGGYRMLAAEAGHISENLVLAATALGLRAHPCGGFLDGMLNHELGLATDDEQFLLGVLAGNADVQ